MTCLLGGDCRSEACELGGNDCTVSRGTCSGKGTGGRAGTSSGFRGEKKPSWPVSAFLKLYHCFTASSQMGQELTATLQSICQLHKVPALWCIFKARQRMLPVGQFHFPHKDNVEKTGFNSDRVCATLS